jgi:hypothetical protein
MGLIALFYTGLTESGGGVVRIPTSYSEVSRVQISALAIVTGCSLFFSVPPGKCPNRLPPYLSKKLFINDPIIPRYVIGAADSVAK